MTPGLAILDAPDIDSVEERNRVLAAQLLAAADLWLFVTSAARYADQVPWDFLRKAAERSAAVAIVLDRTPAEAVDTISTHLARMLASRGLKDSPLFTVEEGEVSEMGLLPSSAVIEIRAVAPGPRRGQGRPGRRWSSRPSTARCARWPVVRTPWPTRPPSRPTPYAGCARTPTRPTTGP